MNTKVAVWVVNNYCSNKGNGNRSTKDLMALICLAKKFGIIQSRFWNEEVFVIILRKCLVRTNYLYSDFTVMRAWFCLKESNKTKTHIEAVWAVKMRARLQSEIFNKVDLQGAVAKICDWKIKVIPEKQQQLQKYLVQSFLTYHLEWIVGQKEPRQWVHAKQKQQSQVTRKQKPRKPKIQESIDMSCSVSPTVFLYWTQNNLKLGKSFLKKEIPILRIGEIEKRNPQTKQKNVMNATRKCWKQIWSHIISLMGVFIDFLS